MTLRRLLTWLWLPLVGVGMAHAQGPPSESPAPPPRTPFGTPLDIPAVPSPVRPEGVPTGEVPVGGRVALPTSAQQIIRFGPRYGVLNTATSEPQPDPADPKNKDKQTQRITYQGGLVINVEYLTPGPNGVQTRRVELSADNVVMWVKGAKAGFGVTDTLRAGDQPADPKKDDKKDGEKKDGEKAEEKKKVTVQMYLSGGVVIRTKSDGTSFGTSEQVFRAAEIYYDTADEKAVAVNADYELRFGRGGFDPLHIRANEIQQLGKHELHAFGSTMYSSKRPADPVLTLTADHLTMTEQVTQRRSIFGVPFHDPFTSTPDVVSDRLVTADRPVTRLLGLPVFATRQTTIDVNDPLGPLRSVYFRSDRQVFGKAQVYTSFDVYDLLGLRRPTGNDWLLNVDYLSFRGLGLGSDFNYRDTFGPAYRNTGTVSVYGLSDKAPRDLLGGFRGPEPEKPDYRARFLWMHNQDLYEEGTAFVRAHGQFGYESDKNFREQFWQYRYTVDQNPETFAYLYGGSGNFAWSVLGEVNVNRPWVTETQWLPRADGALIGQTFLDTFVSTTRASAGYALLRPADDRQTARPTQPGEQRDIDTLRADVSERLSLPFDLGPVRLEPYVVGRGTAYSATADSNEGIGRLYGGGGVKASVQMSKLDPTVQSDLWNLRGLNHKIELRANYFVAGSSVSHDRLPYLDRLNDEANDFSYRGWRRSGGNFNKNGVLFSDTPAGIALNTSPIFDPQMYANRRLVQSSAESVDDMQAVQVGLHQRWQTKRGPSGSDHTTDWMSLDLTGTYFPDPNRDNFGKEVGLLEYNWVWNVGDRLSVNSAGWLDPFPQGTKYLNVGLTYSRPDGSNVYLNYRQVDPLGSRVFIVGLGYRFTPKYSVVLSNSVDVSSNFSQGTTVAFVRTGTDLTMSLGLSYNSFQNNLGFQFLIVPNIGLSGRRGSVTNPFQ